MRGIRQIEVMIKIREYEVREEEVILKNSPSAIIKEKEGDDKRWIWLFLHPTIYHQNI